MRIAKQLAASALLTLAAAAVLTWLPHAVRQPENRDVAVFMPLPAKRMSNDNVVGLLIGLDLNQRIERVGWSAGTLSVDLILPPEASSPENGFKDMLKLIRFSFSRMENVNRLLLRFQQPAAGAAEGAAASQPELLLAADIRREDSGLLSRLDELERIDPAADPEWRKKLRLTFTPAWEKRFGSAPGFTTVS